jgi:hypothetical protein
MSPETFRKRLEDGRCNNHLYTSGDKEGLISVWKHQGNYVLTWEECPKGAQYNESSYTRDERYLLASVDEVIRFLIENGLTVETFRP